MRRATPKNAPWPAGRTAGKGGARTPTATLGYLGTDTFVDLFEDSTGFDLYFWGRLGAQAPPLLLLIFGDNFSPLLLGSCGGADFNGYFWAMWVQVSPAIIYSAGPFA